MTLLNQEEIKNIIRDSCYRAEGLYTAPNGLWYRMVEAGAQAYADKLKVDDEGLVKPYNPCNDCHFYIKEPNEIRYTCHRKIGICTEFRQYEGAFVQYSSDNKKLSYLSRRIQDKDNEIERLKNELTHIKQQHPEDNW